MADYLRFDEIGYTELEALDPEKTIFVLSISLMEEHGPHMPFGVDVYVAEFLADKITEAINKDFPDFTIVKFMPIPVGSGGIRWLGTINSKQRTMRKIVIDYASHLGKYGFKYFLLSNGHGGLGHVVALEEAARKCSKKYDISVISPSGRIAYEFLTGQYTEIIEKKMGITFSEKEKVALLKDSHAGWWETSVMLLINKNLVKAKYKELKPYYLTRWERFTNKKYPGDQGYRGDPAFATAEFAKAATDTLVEKTMELIRDWLKGIDITERASSPLYRLLFFRTNFDRTIFSIIFLLIILIVYFILS